MPSDPAPQPRKKPRGALIGGAAALLILVVGVGAASALRPSGSSESGSPRSTVATEAAVAVSARPSSAPTPVARRWDLPGLAQVEAVPMIIQDVDDDRAVAYIHEQSQEALEGRLMLLDARSRTALWDVPSPAIGAEHAPTVSEVVGDVLLVKSYETGRFRALDLATGRTLSETPDGAQVLACRRSADCSALGDDIVIAAGGIASRVPADDLDAEPTWSVPADEWSASVLDGKVVSGEHAYDLETGAEVPWAGEADVQYSEAGDGLAVGTTYIASGWRVVDSSDGQPIRTLNPHGDWREEVADGTLITESDGTTTAIDLTTGQERWSVPGRRGDDTPHEIGFPSRSDLITVPGLGGLHLNVISRRDGQAAFEMPLSAGGPDDWPWEALTWKPGELVMQDIDGLTAFDPGTGDVLWTYPVDNDHDFTTIGSHIVRPSMEGGFHLDTIEVS